MRSRARTTPPYVMRWVEPIAAPKFDPDLCGTMKGWRQHRDFGQPQCRECLDAANEYQNAYRDRKRAGRQHN